MSGSGKAQLVVDAMKDGRIVWTEKLGRIMGLFAQPIVVHQRELDRLKDRVRSFNGSAPTAFGGITRIETCCHNHAAIFYVFGNRLAGFKSRPTKDAILVCRHCGRAWKRDDCKAPTGLYPDGESD